MKKLFILVLILFLTTLYLFSATGEIIISVDTVIGNLCQGGNAAEIHVTVSGGAAPYTFQWNGPQGLSETTEDITGLLEGEYFLTVTDQLVSTAVFDTLLSDPNPNATFIDFSHK